MLSEDPEYLLILKLRFVILRVIARFECSSTTITPPFLSPQCLTKATSLTHMYEHYSKLPFGIIARKFTACTLHLIE